MRSEGLVPVLGLRWIQMVHPSLSALFSLAVCPPSQPRVELVGNLLPLLRLESEHQLLENVVLLLGPRSFLERRVSVVKVPLIETLTLGPPGHKISYFLPVMNLQALRGLLFASTVLADGPVKQLYFLRSPILLLRAISAIILLPCVLL